MTYEGPGHVGMGWRPKQGEDKVRTGPPVGLDPLGFGVHVFYPSRSGSGFISLHNS